MYPYFALWISIPHVPRIDLHNWTFLLMSLYCFAIQQEVYKKAPVQYSSVKIRTLNTREGKAAYKWSRKPKDLGDNNKKVWLVQGLKELSLNIERQLNVNK